MKKINYFYWVPAVLFASFIFYMSQKQDPPGASLFEFLPNSDKIAHMTEYFILSLLIYLALIKAHALKVSSAVFFTVIFASIYGASDEFHQSFTPGRSMDILDWFADLTGAVTANAGILLHKVFDKKN